MRCVTAQINDKVFHRKVAYSIAGISGSGLFEPQAHGIEPVSMSSACWRGYYVEYAIEDSQLILTQVTLGLSKGDELRAKAGYGPPLFDILPRQESQRCAWVYGPLHVPMSFTGGLLLADGFIRELYVHMGFHPAWKYRQVREVLLEGGQLTDDFDRSAQMEDARTRFSAQPLKPDLAEGRQRMTEWIEQCFSRDYTRKRGG